MAALNESDGSFSTIFCPLVLLLVPLSSAPFFIQGRINTNLPGILRHRKRSQFRLGELPSCQGAINTPKIYRHRQAPDSRCSGTWSYSTDALTDAFHVGRISLLCCLQSVTPRSKYLSFAFVSQNVTMFLVLCSQHHAS